MPNPLSTDIWLREAESGCLDLTRSEIWWTDPFPKVRDRLQSYKDPGWYDNPPGTLAMNATEDELHRDGIDVKAPSQVEPET